MVGLDVKINVRSKCKCPRLDDSFFASDADADAAREADDVDDDVDDSSI